MANLANAVIVGALIFLGLLTAFWYTSEVRSPDTIHVAGASANWTEGSGGPALELTLRLDNPRRTEAQVERVTLQPWLGNQSLLAQTRATPGAVVEGRSDGWVIVPVQLPPDFGSRFWKAYAESGEGASFRIEGAVHVVQSVRRHEVPFEWTADWEGDWAGSLEDRLANCEEDPEGPDAGESLCLSATAAQWTGGGLRLQLTLGNPGEEAATVTNATARLRFGESEVASGGGPGELRIPAGGEGTLAVVLRFDDAGLDAWWPSHVTACESSPSGLRIHLEVVTDAPKGPDGNATAEPDKATLQWSFDGPEVRTYLVCGAEP